MTGSSLPQLSRIVWGGLNFRGYLGLGRVEVAWALISAVRSLWYRAESTGIHTTLVS